MKNPQQVIHDGAFGVGDPVRTHRGAAFAGRLLVIFPSLDGTPHGVVEAIERKFKRTLHVYPLGQLMLDMDASLP